MTLSWNCCIHYPSVSLAVTVIITSFPTLPPHDFLSITLSVSRSQTASNLSATVSKPTKRYVCHTFIPAICQNRNSIVTRDTSFKSPCWLIEFVYEAFIHCQTLDREASQVLPRQSFPKVNTGPDMHAHAQKHTHYNTAPRGLGHPADSILFPLNGSCVTKDNLASLWPSYLRGI